MNPLHFVLPKSRLRDFNDNPFDYLLRASGMTSNRSNSDTTVLNLLDDDTPLLPLLRENDTDDDEDMLLLSPILDEQYKREQIDSFIADQQAIQDADADIPDADQLGTTRESDLFIFTISLLLLVLESSIQFSRENLLRSLTSQGKGLIYFIPSPLLLASTCPLSGEQYREDYQEIVERLLQSQLTDIDGLNHRSLTQYTIDYFARHKYVNFTSSPSLPNIYYQCDALFTSSSPPPSSNNEQRSSRISDEESTLSKLVYFITVLNQRSFFSRYDNFDQYLLRHLLDSHAYQIERAFKNKFTFNQLTKGILLEQEQINQLTTRLVMRYVFRHEQDHFQIDVHYFVIDSFTDQFADTYMSLFHTPITMATQHGCLPICESLVSNISFQKQNYWGTLAIDELEQCLDQLLTRRGRISFDLFTSICSSMGKIRPEDYFIEQRIFVHALATCIKHNAKTEWDYLIRNFAKVFYDSCEQYPTDIRHNILAYCVVSDDQ